MAPTVEDFITVPQQAPIGFAWYVILLCIVCLAVPVFSYVFLWLFSPRVKTAKEKTIRIVPPKDLPSLKNKYLQMIAELRAKSAAGQTPPRAGFHGLSRIIRMFVYEATAVRVQNYSLREIEQVGLPALTQLVRMYYEPEFARESGTDLMQSIGLTEGVIRAWN